VNEKDTLKEGVSLLRFLRMGKQEKTMDGEEVEE